jgi:DNA-binding CsgD family transcriptional regulator
MAMRPEQEREITDFLDGCCRRPSCVLVEGEAGIGKTTLWLDAIRLARDRGFSVLTTRPAPAESTVAYASLADLVGNLDQPVLSALPEPQRLAIDRVLLRSNGGGPGIEQRAVAAAFLSIVSALAETAPVLVAIDDIQWLDSSSEFALGFAFRRLSGPVGVLGTVRTEASDRSSVPWIHLPYPDAVQRVTLPPLSVAMIGELLIQRYRRKFSRPAVVRIHAVSRGNPFYALELGRVMNDTGSAAVDPLPRTLLELVRRRIATLDHDVLALLLAASCLADPTLDVIAAAAQMTSDHATHLLEDAESQGIIEISGHRIHFTHPLLARGVYDDAAPASRRAMHRRLASLVDQPELRARHLALGVTSAEPETLQALDVAAAMARVRGAPAAAAELLDVAINLGGDDVERRNRCATYYLDGGDIVRARSLLDETLKRSEKGPLRAAAANLLATSMLYDDFGSSADLLQRFLPEAAGDVALLVQMLLTLAYVLMDSGRKSESLQRVDDAVEQAVQLGQPPLLSRALGMRAFLRFMSGHGVDHAELQRAIAVDDGRGGPIPFQPRTERALLMAWTGELNSARSELRAIEVHSVENGEDGDSHFVSYHRAMVEVWRGDFAEADRIAADMMDRAAHLNGDIAMFAALTIRATLSAYAGRVDDSRRDARTAEEAANRVEVRELTTWLLSIRGFLELSLGNYAATLMVLRPVIDNLLADPAYSEIIAASFVSDAVEAMCQLNRLDEAQELVELMERNGRRLDRPWMLVVALRGRAMWLGARGEVTEAIVAASQAMLEHERLPMPFERARTLLVIGRLERRLRHWAAATAALTEALNVFEEIGTPLWAAQAREKLDRGTPGRPRLPGLTPTERRVAELAADGMSNEGIAAKLFVTRKTVNVNLSRIYRKLGIHSRIELFRVMNRSDPEADYPSDDSDANQISSPITLTRSHPARRGRTRRSGP